VSIGAVVVVEGADAIDVTDVVALVDAPDTIEDAELPLFSVTIVLVVKAGISVVELTVGIDTDAMELGASDATEVEIITGDVGGGADTDVGVTEDVWV
jgi:hypothetical protein